MNQILSIGTENNRNNKPNGPMSDRVVRIFAVLLVIFAVILIGSGIYSLFQNRSNNNGSKVATVQRKKAFIDAKKDEANGTVIIVVESEIKIDKIAYSWNTDTEKTIAGNGELTIEREIDLPSGKNTLNIKVIDVDGNETIQTFDFDSENGSDIIPPNITLTVTEDTKLLITATDETAMSHLTYRWNDDEEETVYVDKKKKDKKTIEVELEIPRGKNVITVVAVDSSTKHNSRTKTETLTGVVKPDISYELSGDGSTITFKCSHEKGIKEISYTLNGVNYSSSLENEEGYPDKYTYVEFDVTCEEGFNRIIVSVTSQEKTVETKDFTYTYGETDNGNDSDNENTTNTSTNRNQNTNTSRSNKKQNTNTNTTDDE